MCTSPTSGSPGGSTTSPQAHPATSRSVGTPAYLAPEQLEGATRRRPRRRLRARLPALRVPDRRDRSSRASSRLASAWAHLRRAAQRADARPRAPRGDRPRHSHGAGQETRRPLPDVRRADLGGRARVGFREFDAVPRRKSVLSSRRSCGARRCAASVAAVLATGRSRQGAKASTPLFARQHPSPDRSRHEQGRAVFDVGSHPVVAAAGGTASGSTTRQRPISEIDAGRTAS